MRADFQLSIVEGYTYKADEFVSAHYGELDSYQHDGVIYQTLEDVSWYDHEDELREFSQKFPETLFLLEISYDDGSEAREYYRNGLMQHCSSELIFEEFDENLLE